MLRHVQRVFIKDGCSNLSFYFPHLLSVSPFFCLFADVYRLYFSSSKPLSESVRAVWRHSCRTIQSTSPGRNPPSHLCHCKRVLQIDVEALQQPVCAHQVCFCMHLTSQWFQQASFWTLWNEFYRLRSHFNWLFCHSNLKVFHHDLNPHLWPLTTVWGQTHGCSTALITQACRG